uniref:Polyprotein n=1 Tax=Cajanus cajan TaxID=3821 RepID=A0A151QTS8_CAJCA|nr:polyprotein [Cajanus cajan]
MTTSKKQWKGLTKSYPSTTLDLAIEDRDPNNSSFNANNVYEWNIDGKSKYNIMHMLQHMTMVCTAYQTAHESSEEAIANIIVSGFTGQLKDIFSAVKIDDNGEPIFHNGETIPDVVNTLVFNIAQHFIGDPSLWKDRSVELLSNLKCKTLGDFKWYKDTFLTRVFTREDSQQPFWKENFLAGLPRSLGDKEPKGETKHPPGKKSIVCYNCKKPGHMSMYCRLKRKNSNLNLEPELEEQISSLLVETSEEDKNLIRPSKSPWSCAAFYFNKQAGLERGTPRLVINYKPLNQALRWIRYPIPNKKDLLNRLYSAKIFSKFDMKSGYWHIQIQEEERYKIAFTVPFGQYEWNVMPFGLKNALLEFQKIMNDIFNPYTSFSIVYIDDVLIFSQSLDQHFKHVNIFVKIIKQNGLAVSSSKIFLGHIIHQGKITPISRSIEFSDKFPNQIIDKTQLPRFLGCLNYVADFIPNLNNIIKPLHDCLKKNPPSWSDNHTTSVNHVK